MKENKEEYKYFIENDIPIDRYIKLISQDGVWGGQLEMSILAKINKFNVIVHQVDHEDMAQEFHDWNTKGLKVIHVTYHRGRHYNSVRSKKDPGYGPAYKHKIDHPLINGKGKEEEKIEPKDEESKSPAFDKPKRLGLNSGSNDYSLPLDDSPLSRF